MWLRFSYELAPVYGLRRGFVGRVQLCKVYQGKLGNIWNVLIQFTTTTCRTLTPQTFSDQRQENRHGVCSNKPFLVIA